ncbi:substrate-binding domain-containing protein [Arthrobacter sp. MYb224]|uniref:substrate-binding domain-containing protein n=1 Tax=Arthrobacter sp. MYb224 TaxID=1848600 RepID=UPI002157C81F|nr:substrate-binding domain-containing protein [Arthrobacter sp. MYb224]
MNRTGKVLTALSLGAVMALTACAPTAEPGSNGAAGPGAAEDSVNIGIIYSKTGPLAAEGDAYLEGLQAGLDYATDGTGRVGDFELNITYHDDGGEADQAAAVAGELVGKDYKVLAGAASSEIALKLAGLAAQDKVLYISGSAATDAISGANKYTFRSGRQYMQDAATAGTFLDDVNGKKIAVFTQDNAFGQEHLAAAEAVLGLQGANVSNILVPEDVTDFAPFARQLVDAKPDLIYAAWAGASSGSMWQALDRQGAFEIAPIVTGLGEVTTYGAFGGAGEKISFFSHYFPGAAGTDVEQEMISAVAEAGKEAGQFSPDGFVAGQMIARAVGEGGNDVEQMVTALEGWSFEGPQGETTVRASDHGLVQNMYRVSLAREGENWIPDLLETVPGEDIAPPEIVN